MGEAQQNGGRQQAAAKHQAIFHLFPPYIVD
jgi:hypothetical protein